MQIIVLKSFRGLAKVGSIDTVKSGYAKNYLVPMGIAKYATAQSIKELELNREAFLAQNDIAKKKALEVKEKLSRHESFFLIRAASDDGKLYGSVTAKDVIKAISEKSLFEGMKIEKSDVNLGFGIRSIGIHQCSISLHGEVMAIATLNVCRTIAEGEVTAKKAAEEKEKLKNEETIASTIRNGDTKAGSQDKQQILTEKVKV